MNEPRTDGCAIVVAIAIAALAFCVIAWAGVIAYGAWSFYNR